MEGLILVFILSAKSCCLTWLLVCLCWKVLKLAILFSTSSAWKPCLNQRCFSPERDLDVRGSSAPHSSLWTACACKCGGKTFLSWSPCSSDRLCLAVSFVRYVSSNTLFYLLCNQSRGPGLCEVSIPTSTLKRTMALFSSTAIVKTQTSWFIIVANAVGIFVTAWVAACSSNVHVSLCLRSVET